MKKCPFCAEEIQDEAIKCKHCGSLLNQQPQAPTGANTQTQVQTIEKTSKKFKGQTILASAGIIFGIFLLIGASSDNSNGGIIFGSILTAVSLIWLIVIKIRTWWHHG